MSRILIAVLAGSVALAGCGYSPPAEVKAIRGDWIVEGPGAKDFEVLILDPSMDMEFYWYESHKYTNGNLVTGTSGNFKYQPGRLSLKLPSGSSECEIATVTANELALRANGKTTTYRRMTEADYDRVDWTVSKIDRLKPRGPKKAP
jgi:hypothetical protein